MLRYNVAVFKLMYYLNDNNSTNLAAVAMSSMHCLYFLVLFTVLVLLKFTCAKYLLCILFEKWVK